MRKNTIYLSLLVLVLGISACGTSNTGQKVADSTSIPPASATQVITQMDATKLPASLTATPVTTAKDTPDPFADKIYAIGEVVVLQDLSIILNSATFSGDLLTANFSIANTSTDDMLISSLLNFSAKKSDGLKLEQSLENCGGIGDMLDGGLFAGQKKRGIICYQTGGVTDITIYYVPDPYGPVSVAWKVKK